MQIIAGTFKGRRLKGPVTDDVRPTSDRLRETLFNVLGPSMRGLRVVDAFAGTAAVGLEAVSRGAAHVTFFERDRRAWQVAEANIALCGAGASSVLHRSDFLRSHGGGDADLVFLDPPYDDDNLHMVLRVAVTHLAPEGTIVVEHRRSHGTHGAPGLVRTRVMTSGDSALSFYRGDGAVPEE